MRSAMLLSYVLFLGFTSPIRAETETIRRIAPLIDDETWLVFHLDLSRFELAKAMQILRSAHPELQELEPIEKLVRAWQTSFATLGGREIFVVYGGSDFPRDPAVLIPVADGQDGRALLPLFSFLESGQAMSSRKVAGFFAIGTPTALDQLSARKPAARDDLVAALKSTGDAPVQFAFSPSASARTIIADLAPNLPAELGGGNSTTLTQAMKWLAFSIVGAPEFTLRGTIQASDAQAATTLGGIWKKLVAVSGEAILPDSSTNREPFKWLQRARELFTPVVEGSSVKLQLDTAKALPELGGLATQLRYGPERSRSGNNLKQLMIAVHSYHDAHGFLPRNVTDAQGKELLSWRVLILPYLDHGALFAEFKLDEAWDSAHNKKLIEKMPRVLRSPRQDAKITDRTTYLAPTGPGLMWEKGQKIAIQAIPDGTSNTIALVEADDELATIWTRPGDFILDTTTPTRGLLGHYTDGFLAALGDGSVRFFKKETKMLPAWFTRAGGEVIEPVSPKSIKK